MASSELAPHLQRCQNCGAIVDMSDEQPLKKVRCSVCQAEMTVKRRFPHFTLERIVGEGGMGTVYAARDINLHRAQAVKLMNRSFTEDDRSRIDSLMMEAKIMASLNHQNVVKVFSSGFDNDQFYITMELVPGGSLDDLMESRGRVPEAKVLKIGIDVAKGLKAAHEQGLVHRDVKPGNILFADDGMAKVVDFGLARTVDDEKETDTEIWGTPYYVPPETLNREKEDFRSDIYSLGATLFHAIAGRPPFEAENASLVAIKHLKNQPVSLKAFAPDVADETAYVINRMLNKDPDARFNSYDELIDHFQYAYQKVSSEGPRRNVLREQSRKEKSETTRLFGLVTFLLLVLSVGAALTIFLLRDRLTGEHIDPNSPEGKLEMVKMAVAENRLDDAGNLLTQLDRMTNAGQPIPHWTDFHNALISLLKGDVQSARKSMGQLENIVPYSPEEEAVEVSNFFAQTARAFSGPNAVALKVSDQFKNDGLEALSLLMFGLKNYHLGKYRDSAQILSRFKNSVIAPNSQYTWINNYKTLTDDYLADAQTFVKIQELVAGARTPAAANDALDELRTLRSQVRGKGDILKDINSQEQMLLKKTK